jgi:hypothetical protein
MDAYLEKEQIGTLFVWVGAPEGEFGGFLEPPACSIAIGSRDGGCVALCLFCTHFVAIWYGKGQSLNLLQSICAQHCAV